MKRHFPRRGALHFSFFFVDMFFAALPGQCVAVCNSVLFCIVAGIVVHSWVGSGCIAVMMNPTIQRGELNTAHLYWD